VELLHDRVALAVGVDIDWQSLIEHRVRALRRVCAQAEQLPFPDESFDLIVCSWVLEHLAQPDLVFAEVARVLRGPDPLHMLSSGHFVFLAPNAWHPLIWVNRVLRRADKRQRQIIARLYGRVESGTFPAVYRANTRDRISRLAERAGLRVANIRLVSDPTYLALNDFLFNLAVRMERYLPARMKIHVVGDFVKADTGRLATSHR
jgi:SAM-dependent methyltransferase